MTRGSQDPHPLPQGSLTVRWWQVCPPWPRGEDEVLRLDLAKQPQEEAAESPCRR